MAWDMKSTISNEVMLELFENEGLTCFIVDAVPLRRTELLCSVNTTIFAKGNSNVSGLAKLTGCGERKYLLPIGD